MTGAPTRAASPPSEVAARYLEALYYIRAEGMSARPARLAQWLGVSRPTVTLALRRLARDGLLRLEASKEIELTPRGASEAAALVRRHRITERWLTDHVGLDWVAADEEAARLEHAISETVVGRLYELLGRPLTCPHGNPIPGHSEQDPDEIRLSQIPSGQTVRLTRISEVAEREVPLLLGQLLERRLVPGAVLEVGEHGAERLALLVEGRRTQVTLETAERIWAVPYSTPAS
ncbi:MAG TPA: metal-dependent transcriptional regulator [Candidatus Nitrosotalea sp.]|nr:metal-dependent transcriptional regulator [Candidatus Nitrosotalea sp.]